MSPPASLRLDYALRGMENMWGRKKKRSLRNLTLHSGVIDRDITFNEGVGE